MKKFISISKTLLAFSLDREVTGAAATLDENAPGGAGQAQEPKKEIKTTEYVLSEGTVVDLPEEHEYVKDLITKKRIKEYVEPAPEKQPEENKTNTGDENQTNTGGDEHEN